MGLGVAYAGLVGVFICCMFTQRGNAWSLSAGLAVGVGTMLGFFLSGIEGLAFPWQFVIASLGSLAVSLLGSPNKAPSLAE